MKVIYLSSAKANFRSIIVYATKHYERKAAKRIRTDLLSSVELLTKHPRLGQFEPYLEHLDQGHRRLVVGNYKIIYRIEPGRVVVCDFFDGRRDPETMKGG